MIKERQMNINIFTSRLCSRNAYEMKRKKNEEEEIRQLLFLFEYEQTGIDIDDDDDDCIRNETSFVLQVIIRLGD